MLEKVERIYKLGQFQELMKYSYMDAEESYEVLGNHEDDLKYQLSLGYLNLSFVSYLQLKDMYARNIDLQHYEIEPFFSSYDNYIFELKKVITKKDNNTSWLYSAYSNLKENWIHINKFISESIKSA